MLENRDRHMLIWVIFGAQRVMCIRVDIKFEPMFTKLVKCETNAVTKYIKALLCDNFGTCTDVAVR